jgi:hypothetical protein
MSTKDIFRNSNEVCYKIEKLRQEQKPGRADHEEDGRSGHDLQRHPRLSQGVPDQDRRQAGWRLHRLLGPRPSELGQDRPDQRVRQGQVCLRRDARHRHEWDIPVVSASQLNRQSVGEQEFDHSHIAGGISKINTADNVFGIFTSQSMREGGKYRLQFLKTRSSSAVGSQVDLPTTRTACASRTPRTWTTAPMRRSPKPQARPEHGWCCAGCVGCSAQSEGQTKTSMTCSPN